MNTTNIPVLKTLPEAIRFFEETMAAQPERDGLAAEEAAWTGQKRRYPTFGIGPRIDPADQRTAEPVFEMRETKFADDDEGRLAGQIVQALTPLDMLNPVWKAVNLEGAGTPAALVPSFGIPKSDDGGAAAYTLSIREMLKRLPPDPETAGLMPTFKRSATRIQELTPSSFKINMPDLQGPFNLLHAMVSDEAFTAPYIDPEGFHALMEGITDFWIAAATLLASWIGKERLRLPDTAPRIAECSVNLVSADFYKEHILAYDLRIARQLGPVRIHPCSGIHVYEATLENLPVVATEAGMMIAPMAAPVISVRKALDLIGDRPVMLTAGQELPEDRDEAFKIVADDIDLALESPRLFLGHYTGIFWRKKERPMIRDFHRDLDCYWAEKSGTRLSVSAK